MPDTPDVRQTVPQGSPSACDAPFSAPSRIEGNWSVADLVARPTTRLADRTSSLRSRPEVTCLRQAVESTAFTSTTLAVICINAIWIGIDTEWNNATLKRDGSTPLEPYSFLVENVFCVYFTLEVLLRFIVFENKRELYKDLWLLFDTTLVLLMILETWVFPIIDALGGAEGGADLSNFSTLRILRLTRMVRMARSIGVLRTLVRGMIASIRAVVSLLVFLVGLTYVFAIFFTTVLACPPSGTHKCDDGWTHEVGEEDPLARYLFGSIGSSMMTLFTNGMLGDNLYWALTIIKNESLLMYWLFCIYFSISALTLLNMLIGVLCDTIQETDEKEKRHSKELDFQETMERCFQKIDKDKSGTVTYDEWCKIKQDPGVREIFADVLMVHPDQVDDTMTKMEAVLFSQARHPGSATAGRVGVKRDSGLLMNSPEGEEGLSRRGFVKMMVKLSPDKQASPMDIELLRTLLGRFEMQVSKRIDRLKDRVLQQPSSLFKGKAACIADSPAPALAREPSSSPATTVQADAPGGGSCPTTPGQVQACQVLQDLQADGSHQLPQWVRSVPTEFLVTVLRIRARRSEAARLATPGVAE